MRQQRHATSATDARMAEDWFVQAYSLQDITLDLFEEECDYNGCEYTAGKPFFPTNLGEQIGAQSNLPSPLSPQEKGQKDVEKVVFFLEGKYISRTPNITYVLLLSGLGLYKLYNDPKYP